MRHCSAFNRISIIHGKSMNLRNLLYFNTIKQQPTSHLTFCFVFQLLNGFPYIHPHLIMAFLFILHDLVVPLFIYSNKSIGIYLAFLEIHKETEGDHRNPCV